jgi:hypothetical protein
MSMPFWPSETCGVAEVRLVIELLIAAQKAQHLPVSGRYGYSPTA